MVPPLGHRGALCAVGSLVVPPLGYRAPCVAPAPGYRGSLCAVDPCGPAAWMPGLLGLKEDVAGMLALLWMGMVNERLGRVGWVGVGVQP